MTEEAKQARLAYRREWQKKNRDKVKAYNETYWEKKAAAMKAEAAQQDGVEDQAPANDAQS